MDKLYCFEWVSFVNALGTQMLVLKCVSTVIPNKLNPLYHIPHECILYTHIQVITARILRSRRNSLVRIHLVHSASAAVDCTLKSTGIPRFRFAA